MRRMAIFVSSLVLVGLFQGGMAQAQERGTTCKLDGKAAFTPGLTVTPSNNSYTFSGKLTGCQSTGKVTKGKVSAAGKGSVACEGGTSKGKAKIVWNTGKETYVSFSTTDVGALVAVKGTVTKTYEKSFKKGDDILGALVFEADPTQCQAGLKSASFTGQVGGGSPS